MEHLLVKFHYIFACLRLGIGFKAEFQVTLTIRHDDPVCAQSSLEPTNPKDEILVQQMQVFDDSTTLPSSKNSCPTFAQRNPFGMFRLLIDLKQINHLISHDYIDIIHTVSTIADAVQHLAGKIISVSWIANSRTIAFRWQISSQSNSCHSTLVLRNLHNFVLFEG